MRILIILAMAMYIAIIPKSCSLIDLADFELTKEQKELIHQAVIEAKKILDSKMSVTPIVKVVPTLQFIEQNEEVKIITDDTARLLEFGSDEGKLIQHYDSLDVPVIANVEEVLNEVKTEVIKTEVIEAVKTKIDNNINEFKSAFLNSVVSITSNALTYLAKSIF